jgi:predicted nucleotidyltransferase component of viral defense system
MFLGVECWRTKDLTLERIREVAKSLDLPSSLVEREIIFYDTLEAIGSYSPVEVVLKGGTLISRLYSGYPRFSWDINLCADLKSKEEYDLEELNNRMGEKRLARLRVGRRELELGKFERDLEKDVFADLLSLKRDMLTWSLGAPLPTYLRKLGWTHHEISQIRKIGTIPFVESVRCTVSLSGVVSGKRRKIPSIIEKKLPPVRRAEVRVYPPELCIIEKLGRFSRNVDEIGLRDLLCDFYDLGQLLNLELDEKILLESYRQSYSNRQIPSPVLLQRRLRENLSIVKRNLDSFKKRREFVHCRYDWDKYFSDTKKKLEQLLELLS